MLKYNTLRRVSSEITHLHDIRGMGTIVVCVALAVVGLDYGQPGLTNVLIDVQGGKDVEAAEHLHAQIEQRMVVGDLLQFENIKVPAERFVK